MTAGNLSSDYLRDSLFDQEAVENKGKKRDYKQGIDHHLATASGMIQFIKETCLMSRVESNKIRSFQSKNCWKDARRS